MLYTVTTHIMGIILAEFVNAVLLKGSLNMQVANYCVMKSVTIPCTYISLLN